MKRRYARLSIAAVVAVGVVVTVFFTLRAAAPSWMKGRLERVVGDALGRELKIAGAFDLSFSLTPEVTASDLTLTNAPWGSQASMVRVGRIRVVVELASLWSGPVRVRELTIDDARVLLETGGGGERNWIFDTMSDRRPSAQATEPLFVVDRASMRRFELTYRPPRDGPPMILGIDALNAALDPVTRMIDVGGKGHFNDNPWDLSGRLGTIERLIEMRDWEQALSGHVGLTALTLSGRIRDPMSLSGPNVKFSLDGPDVVGALAAFGLRSPLTGPFRLNGRLEPHDDGIGFDAGGEVGGVTATARGTMNALLDPSRIDAAVDAHGTHASEIGAWTGIAGLPAVPFDLDGRIRRDGSRLSVEDVRLHAGGTSLTVSGPLGELPRAVGCDLQIAAKGMDLAELSALTRLDLPDGAFELTGRFLRRADALAIEQVRLAIGGAVIHASGTIGEPPRLATLDLTAEGEGPDASILSGVVRIDLPPESFALRGRVARNGAALTLDDVAGQLGGDRFALTGHLAPIRGLVGTDAHVRVAGDDLNASASEVGLHGLPAQPYEAVGRVRVATDHVVLDNVDATVGGVTVRVDGVVGSPSPRNGTSLLCRGRAAALSGLSAWGLPANLPPDPVSATGRLTIDEGVYRVEDVSAELGADHLEASGALGALPDVSLFDLEVTASGPRLTDLGRFAVAAGSEPPPRLPAEAFSVTGRVRRATSGVELLGITGGVGNATLDAFGTLSLAPGSLGTDLTIEVKAPDTVMLSDVAGTDFPEGELRARGRIRCLEEGLRLDGAELSLGASFAQVTGLVGRPPDFAGTAVDLSVEGPDLAAAVAPWIGTLTLPADSFALSGRLAGSLDLLTSEQFTARLGNSDLAGSVSMDLTGRPFVDADLRSRHFDAPRLVAGFTREPEPKSDAEAATKAPAKKPRRKREHLIPDWPLELGSLGAFDAQLKVTAAEIPFPGIPVRDVVIAGTLRDGALTIDRSDGTGTNGGRLTSSFSLRPEGDGYRLHVDGNLEGSRLHVSESEADAASAPSLEVSYQLEGAGRSLHEIAAGANGQALVVLGPGRIPNTFLGGNASATLISLMDALNPFRKSSPYTTVECGVAAAAVQNGMMAVAPIAVRGDKLTVVGKGKLDLGTEAIDLSWTVKPRRNVGISPGSIANPFIRLGGTLAAPHLDVKPFEAAVSTGAAVATAGLTILLRGIYNRITAEKQVCVQALAKVKKLRDEAEAKKNASPRE